MRKSPRRVWTGFGAYLIGIDPAKKHLPCRDQITVWHDGALRLEITDPATIERVMRLFAWDIFQEGHR